MNALSILFIVATIAFLPYGANAEVFDRATAMLRGRYDMYEVKVRWEGGSAGGYWYAIPHFTINYDKIIGSINFKENYKVTIHQSGLKRTHDVYAQEKKDPDGTQYLLLNVKDPSKPKGQKLYIKLGKGLPNSRNFLVAQYYPYANFLQPKDGEILPAFMALGRRTSLFVDPATFSLDAYRRHNPSLASLPDSKLVDHFLWEGLPAGLSAHDVFIPRRYYEKYLDSVWEPYPIFWVWHYLTFRLEP